MKRSGLTRARLLACLVLVCLTAAAARAQSGFDVRANYEKREVRIEMRDGARLFTSIYAPRDRSRPYPILLSRTPYSVRPYGDDYRTSVGPSEHFAREGYIVVYQDVRGRWMSEGDYVNVRPHKARKAGPRDIDESTDTYDTIDWLVKNVPNNNGRVGMWGISYPGFYTSMGIIDAHPALRAASPQAPIADWFIGDDFHHNGALFLPHGFNFLASFGQPRPRPTDQPLRANFTHGTPDGYKFFLELGPLSNADAKYYKGRVAFWNEMMEHPNYDDYWKARNVLPHLRGIRPAVMTVGGWFDAEDLYGALKTYEWIEKNNPASRNALVMGPWCHGCWARTDGDTLGDIRFGEKTGEFYRREIEFPFFQCLLKDRCDEKLPEAYVFETGSNRWRKHDAWPPRGAREMSLYLDASGRLSTRPPTAAPPAFDEYVSDPARPVPHINTVNIGMTGDYMIQDQRFASRRPDVLVYQTEPLREDVTLSGPVAASLFVSTSGTDSDFVVKLIDVFPDDAPDPEPNPKNVRMGGYQMLVRGEPMRARFRHSFERPEPMRANRPERVEFVMPDAAHTFKRGHRIMVQIQSTWFPLVDRNPQTFVPNINRARASDFRKATQRVYRAPQMPSRVRLTVLP